MDQSLRISPQICTNRSFSPSRLHTEPHELSFTEGYCKYLVELPNARLFAIADTEGKVTFWDSESLKHVYTIVPHKGWINHMLYLNNSRLLITTSTDQALCVYSIPQDIRNSTEKGRVESNWVIHLLDLEEEGMFGSCSECFVKLWDIKTLELVEVIRSYSCHFWVYIKKMRAICFAHDDGTIGLYILKKKKWRRSIALNTQNMSSATFSLIEYIEKLNLLVTLAGGDKILLWKISPKGIQCIKKMTITDLSNSVPCLVEGKYLLGSDGEGKIFAYNTINGKVLREIDAGIEPLMWLFLKSERKIIVPDIMTNKIYVLKYT